MAIKAQVFKIYQGRETAIKNTPLLLPAGEKRIDKVKNMEKKKIVTEWAGMNVMQERRWICIQDLGNGRHWFYEPSLSYKRSESIQSLVRHTTMTWREAKAKYGWRCKKIFVTLSEI